MTRVIRRILFGLLLAVAGLLAILAASIAVDRLFTEARLSAVANTRIPNGSNPEIEAFVARPNGTGPHPTVIMIHEVWGLNEDTAGKALRLAEQGYVVVAPNLFRRSTSPWLPRAIYQMVATPASQLEADLDAVFAWLQLQPEVAPDRIAVLGFCFGGSTSLQYSLSNADLAATVIFYGQPVTDAAQLEALPGPVLGIFAGEDPTIPAAQVQALEAGLQAAGVPNQINIYEGQSHAFVTSGAIEQGGAAAQAWDETLDFLNRTLKGDQALRRRVTPTSMAALPNWSYALGLAYEHTLGSAAYHH
jgi:carboxymethylenebutenolidase